DEDPYEELLSQVEQHILDKYPNPNRIGCFTPEQLKELVRHPERFDLKDRKYLHLFSCAECTRDVQVLRSELERESAAEKVNAQRAPSNSSPDLVLPPQRRFGVRYRTLAATVLASLCLGGVLVWFSLARHSQK